MSEMEKKVLEAIERGNLAPRPYYWFLAERSVFWTLFVASTVLGALAIAVLLYGISDYYATDLRNFENLPFGELFPSLPFVWVASLLPLVASAYFAVRKTRRGYRYRSSRIVALCLSVSIGLGVLFHFLNVGGYLNDYLTSRSDFYRNETYVPYKEWSHPDEGFLGGTVESVDGKSSLHLKDFHDKEWVVDISSAIVKFNNPLFEEGDIAIRGKRTGEATYRAEVIDSFD